MSSHPIELTPEHLGALARPRRIIDQVDANDPQDVIGTDFRDWIAFRFHHADMTGNQIDGIWWDITNNEDTYALHPSDSRPILRHPGLENWRSQGIDWVGSLVEECRRRGLETFWSTRISEVDPPQPYADKPLTDPSRRNWLLSALVPQAADHDSVDRGDDPGRRG